MRREPAPGIPHPSHRSVQGPFVGSVRDLFQSRAAAPRLRRRRADNADAFRLPRHCPVRARDSHDSGVGATVTFFAPCQLLPGESGPVRLALAEEPPLAASGGTIHLYDGMRLIATGTVH
jgi:hypothetical protein